MAAAVRLPVGLHAVVEDGDLQRRADPDHADLGLGVRARVLLHIGQRLLDDPVRREVDGGRKPDAVVGASHLDRQSGLLESEDQFVEDLQAGGRFGGGLGIAGLPQQSDRGT